MEAHYLSAGTTQKGVLGSQQGAEPVRGVRLLGSPSLCGGTGLMCVAISVGKIFVIGGVAHLI